MKNQAILYGIIGFLVGVLITILITKNVVNNNMEGMMRMMGVRQNQQMVEEREDMMMNHDESMSMKGMVETLEGKTGDDFDKAFINEMIEHHQGAIDMANMAKTSAKHQEIKDLADDIISAQTTEINLMQGWQNTWDY